MTRLCLKFMAMLEVHAEEIIGDWIRHMERHGYRFDQFIVGRHHDKDNKNPHFHFLANVVLDDGTRTNLANIGKAAKEASIFVTEQWGLTPANHRRRMQTKDKQDSNKNKSWTAEIRSHGQQNFIERNIRPCILFRFTYFHTRCLKVTVTPIIPIIDSFFCRYKQTDGVTCTFSLFF